MPATVNISILLKKPWRTPAGVARVTALAEELGIQVSAAGKVTISAKMELNAFTSLFAVVPSPVPSRSPGDNDFGAPAGYAVATDLQVPDLLDEYVETIALAAPPLRLR